MKQSFVISLLILLVSCNNSTSTGKKGSTGSEQSDGELYLRTYTWTGMYGTSLDISWIYMDENGNIVKNPRHGVNPVDWVKEKQDNPTSTGTYKVVGDSVLQITWVNGETDNWGLETKDDEYSIIDGGITTRQEGMPDDYRIEGQYASSVVLPNVAATSTLVFHKDGTFTSSNYGTVTTPDVSGESENKNTGTYDISGNTLTMKFPDGKVEKSVITIWDMEGKKNLVINSKYYPQEK